MATNGKIKIIKNGSGNGGGIIDNGNGSTDTTTSGTGTGTTRDTTSTSGSTTTTVASTSTTTTAGTVSTVGFDTVIVTVSTDGKTPMEFDFNLPFYAAMNLNVGDAVKFEIIPAQNGKPAMGAYMQRIEAGTIASINSDNASGVITERKSGKRVQFYQAHLAELGITVGDSVNYSLIYTSFGEMAVNVRD